ncbi:Zn-ribbon domain-containing OB-fold protein [Nocardia brasiliensis]|uniref:Zn-ribbon domain-containing OB-fold protein n=1 Tax=Nocardia brasiliensis TaxID=37326 RepID=UPI003671B3EC
MNVPVDEITEPWWAATRDRRLLLQRCLECAQLQHYPRALCTGCGSTALDWTQACGRGVVDSFTVVHRAPGPEFEVPYVVARVRLTEGPILLTNLVGAEQWRCDDPVWLCWREIGDGRLLPVFEKENDGLRIDR